MDSSESEIDVLAPFENKLRVKRKWRRRKTLSINQSKANLQKVKHDKSVVDVNTLPPPPKRRRVSRKRKKTVTNKSTKQHTFNYVHKGHENETVCHAPNGNPMNNDSASTIGYSSEGNVSDAGPPEATPSSFAGKAYNDIVNSDVLRKCIDAFRKEDVLIHFVTFLTLIASGQLSVTNIAVLCCLERALLQSMRTTTSMRYRQDTAKFWETVLAIGGGKLLRFFSSDKNFGQINSKLSAKNRYNPQSGDFNFAVPDERTLWKSKTFIPNIVPCGFIEESLPLFNKDKEYVLSLDGKQLGQGLGKYGEGDINLWSFEGPPTLQEHWQRLMDDLKIITNINATFAEDLDTLPLDVSQLKEALRICSLRIKSLREAKVRHEVLRESFKKRMKTFPWKAKNFDIGMSEIDAFITLANRAITKLLKVNVEWCKIMAMVNQNEEHFQSEGPIDLDDQSNGWILLEPDVINDHDFLLENPHYVKQRSTLWFDMRKQSKMTGSSMYNALGLRSFKDQKLHFEHFIEGKTPPEPTGFAAEAMEHGTLYEVTKSTCN